MKSRPRAPSHLEPKYRRIWNQILSGLEFSVSELQTLETGLDCLRRRDQARQILEREGLVMVSKSGTQHKHPAIEIEKIANAGWIAAFRALSLREDEILIRPGRPGGRVKVQNA
jgi:hypothetical protein